MKIRSGETEIEGRPVSPEQSSPVTTAESENGSDKVLLDLLLSLSKINGVSAVQHGARLAVVGELLASMLMHLPVPMRANIVKSFRDRIEDVMSRSDDRSLPEHYHSALLAEINRYLNALR